MAEVEIVDIRKIPASTPNRLGKFDVLVSYRVDSFNAFVTSVPEEDFTEAKLPELIRKAETERLKFLGKKIQI